MINQNQRLLAVRHDSLERKIKLVKQRNLKIPLFFPYKRLRFETILFILNLKEGEAMKMSLWSIIQEKF